MSNSKERHRTDASSLGNEGSDEPVSRCLGIRVEQVVMGFRVYLSGDPEEFERALAEFKKVIPRRVRRFIARRGYWFIEKRAEKRLQSWLNSMRVVRSAKVSTGKRSELARGVQTGAS